MFLLGIFAGIAALLAAIGIYSVLSYSVRQRVPEIGIRLALGAGLPDVLRLIVFEGMKPALLGVGIGIVAALALGRVVASLVYQVKPSDPITFIAVAILLGLIALIACLVPAYRASRVDPVVALRNE
jgi:putative ABC transport system permease protein